MYIDTEGLIIKEQDIGEKDKLLTILTSDNGVIRAFAKGTKGIRSKNSSSTQILCYSRLKINKVRDRYIVYNSEPIEVFFNLCRDIKKLSLSQYFCELALVLVPEHGDTRDFLRLILNALYFVCKSKKGDLLVKSVVELKAMALSGYMPNLVGCENCGVYQKEKMYFIIQKSLIYCDKCKSSDLKGIAINISVLTAMRHIIYSEFEKIFSFTLPHKELILLSNITERYVYYTTQREFNALKFYKDL